MGNSLNTGHDMRALVDLVDSISGTIRFIILAIMGFGLIVTIMVWGSILVIAPQVSEDYADRAEEFGDRAIEAAREEARARDLAEDGWGYSEPRSDRRRSRDPEEAGGWGSASD